MPLEPVHTDAVMHGPPAWSEGDVAFWMVGTQGPNNLWIGRFGSGSIGRRSPWERHLEGQELLHVLEGAIEVTLLLESGTITTRLDAGSIFVVPVGVWHAHTPLTPAIEFGATPGRSEHSTAEDPRDDA
jgi:quercetin dioxygenase-like cupin family protein